MFLKLFLLTIGLLAIAFAGFAIKMFVKKDGEFKKQCSTVEPRTGKYLGCSCEGQPGDGSCGKDGDEKHTHSHSPSRIEVQALSVD